MKRFLSLHLKLCLLLAFSAQAQTSNTQDSSKPSNSEIEELPEVIITAQPDGYTASFANSTTRSEIPLKQLPQSAQVITRKLLDHQLAQDPSTVVKNFSGVVGFDVRELNNASYLIRGFQSEAYLDGFQLYGNGPDTETLINTERIDVVKGPTGTLYGGSAGGPLGGLLNFVSKRPEKDASYMFGFNASSWGAYGNVWDVNQPLDREGRVLFRLTGDIRETRDVNAYIKGHLTSIFPSLAIQIDEDTTLTLRGRYSDRSQTDYSGLPAAGTVSPGGFNFDRYSIFRAENQPATTAKNRSLSAELKHHFNKKWSFTLEANYIDSNLDQFSVFPSLFFPSAGSFYPVDSGTLRIDMASFAFNARVNGAFDTGAFKHSLTAGMEFDQTQESGDLLVMPGIGVIDMSAPVYPQFIPGGLPFSLRDNEYQTLAFYAQDQITFAERFHLMGSLRWSRLKITDVDTAAFVAEQLNEQRLTGRAGLSVDVTDWLTVFAGWGQGFRAPLATIIPAGKKPINSEQWEAGVKFELADTLQGSLAWFRNTRSNVPVPVGLFNVQSGEQVAQGIEADLVWQPTREFSLLLNYAYQDGEVTSDTVLPVGSRLARLPEHSGRAAMRYDIKDGKWKGLGLGLGITLASARAGDAANTFKTSAYATVDAQVSYTRGPATLAIGIQNLLDARYYEPFQFFNGAVAPNAPFNVFCQASVRF